MKWLIPAIAILLGCSESEPPTAKTKIAPRAAVITVTSEPYESARSWRGTLEPLEDIVLSSPLNGVVSSLQTDVGQEVEKGAALIRVEVPGGAKQRSTLIENRDRLRGEVARWERLEAQGAAGKFEGESARLKLAEVESSLAQLSDILITQALVAPARGRVTTLTTRPGMAVIMGQPLFTIRDADSMGVRLTLPAADLEYLAQNINLKVVPLSGEPVDWEVEQVIIHSDLKPGFVQAEIRVTGSFSTPAAVEVKSVTERNALVVPWSAVASDGEERWVGIVVGDPAKVERRVLDLGNALADGVEVLSGLQDGERVLYHDPRSFPVGREVLPVERP